MNIIHRNLSDAAAYLRARAEVARLPFGEDIRVDGFSKDHHLSFIPNVQSFMFQDPNIDTKRGIGYGTQGQTWSRQRLTNYGFAIQLKPDPDDLFLPKVRAMIRNKRPDAISLGYKGFTGNKSFWIANLIDRATDTVVRGAIACEANVEKDPEAIPVDDVSTIDIAGTHKRAVDFNDPLYFEGWGCSATLAPSATPNTLAVVSTGHAWLRRVTGTYVPRRVAFNAAQNTAAFPVTTVGNSRWDAVIAYLNDSGVLTVAKIAGTDAASPTKISDADVETAVDALATTPRWVRIADVLITETATVVINTADIAAPTLGTLTRTDTANGHDETGDSYFVFPISVLVLVDGVVVTSPTGWTDSATTIAAPATVHTCVEIVYTRDPYPTADGLEGEA